MANCPECIPLEERFYNLGVEITNKQGEIDPLRQSLEEGLQPFADRVGDAIGERMQAEAEHTALVQQEAALVADISAMTGAGATAVAAMIGNDMSFTPVEGWIEHRVSPSVTLWFRNEEAIAQFGKAAGLQASLDTLASVRAQKDTSLQNLRDAISRESQRENELSDALAQANARLQEHYDEIARLEEEHHRVGEELAACRRRCERGEVTDQRVGVVGAAMMLGGMFLVVLSNPFGGGQAEAAGTPLSAGSAATVTAASTGAPVSGTLDATPAVAGTPAPASARIGPIAATFDPSQFTTFYTVPVDLEGGGPVEVDWSGADCGGFGYNGGPTDFYWSHPHPPCDATTDHADRTIVARIGIGDASYECRYQGAESGFGEACAGPGGSQVAMAPTTPTPLPTRVTGTAAPAATIAATVSTPTAPPTPSPAPATGGGSAAPTPSPTTTAGGGTVSGPTGDDEQPGGGSSPATTAAGAAMTAAGGAALGYATSRRGGGTRTREQEVEEPADDPDDDETIEEPSPPVRIDTGGRGDDSVTKDQDFRIRVTQPRPASGDPPETIDVELKSVQTSHSETIRLRWTGNVRGDAEYVSEPLTIRKGGTGGGKTTILGFEFSTGDMGGGLSRVPNGTQIEVRVGGQTMTFAVYNSWVQQGIGRSMEGIRQINAFWTNVAVLLQNEPDSEEKESLLRNAREVIRLTGEANRYLNTDWLDTRKLAYLRTILGLIQGDLSSHDRRNEYSYFTAADRSAEEMGMDSLMRGLTGAAIGMWRTAADVTGYASFVKLRYGVDEMGAKVGTLERIFAVLDLAGKMTIYGGARASVGSLTDNIRGPVRSARAPLTPAPTPGTRVDVPSADFRARQLVPTRPPVPPPGSPPIVHAPAGTRVPFPEEFGMLRNRARHFQAIVERYRVRIRVRRANIESLDSMASLNPPKHVKLKSKTINDIDELLGARPGSQGLVGYFEPRLPPRGTMSDEMWAAVNKRYRKRLEEYRDQAKAMRTLQEKGLVRVDDGVVVDTGLSDMRVPDLESGIMVPRGAKPGGTGRPFTGDHDMWDITHTDGRPLDPITKARIEQELMDGAAHTQHGPHKDWVPSTDVDRGIDRAIRESHLGQTGADGVVRPIEVEPGKLSEGLLEFSPGQHPSVSYETGALPAATGGTP